MDSVDFDRDSNRGYKIFMAFKNQGHLTAHQSLALMVLYREGESLRAALKKATQVSNDGQFSSSVIDTLIRKRYIKREERGKDRRFSYSILPEGSELVEEVMEETGYSSQIPRRK